MCEIARAYVYVDAPSEMPANVRDKLAKNCNAMLAMPLAVLEGMTRDELRDGGTDAMYNLYQCVCEAMQNALENTVWEDDESVAVRFYANGYEHKVGNGEF